MFNSNSILSRLEAEIIEQSIPAIMPGDKWLLSSGFQKAVRRAEVERALSAGYSFWRADKDAFWRRLHVLSCEDVGVTAPSEVTKVLLATSSAVWRRRVGDWRVGQHLVGLLCGAVKTRIADEILIQAERAKCHAALRLKLTASDDDALIARMSDDSRPLVERCLSAWYLAGMKRFPTDIMPQRIGSMDKAVAALRALDIPAALTEACIGVINRTQWPLALFTPIIAQEMRKHSLHPRQHEIPAVGDVSGLPLYSADIFTRTGRACFAELRKAALVLKPFTIQQVGLGIFYLEGGLIDRTATAPALDAIRQAGEDADIEFSRLAPTEYTFLKNSLIENMGLLADIRTEHLRRYLPTVTQAGMEA